jgi:3-oxoacyl-(acyl-carrier-protein) synthase
VISPLGNSPEASRHALLNAECGIGTAQLVKSKFAGSHYFGEVKLENEKLREQFNITNPGVTRTSLLALHAMSHAIADSGLKVHEIQSYETALVGASTVGGMCNTDELYSDAKTDAGGSPFISSYDCATVSFFLQRYFGVQGVINTINTACSSSANAIMYGARLISNGYAKRAIVGGADSLAKFTINGFNSLGILSPGFCKPFDKERNGLNLGEGAAFLVLEREEDAASKKIYGVLSGYCNTNDAYHPSSLSENGQGPYNAMQGALLKSGLAAGEISYINTHGTGTENNDEVESKAMLRVFEKVPPFASTKSKIGHTLGASASVETVFSLLALMNDEVYPSLNFSLPIESTGLRPVISVEKRRLKNIMINSFGFGGNCSSLVFSKI